MIHLLPLAEVDDDKVTPGVLGFVVFAVLAVAVWGLMKSMNRHMRRVDFREQDDAPGQDGTTPARTAPEQRKASAAGKTK